MATVTAGAVEQFTEYCDSRGVHVGIGEGVLRGVKILGPESSNGRVYPKETMARALSLYEGVKVNINHANPRDRGLPRDYQDRIGVIRNARLGEGVNGIYADFHFNPKHPLAEQLLWDAQHAPENLGFSHDADGTTSHKAGKAVVESITRVKSVDLVADPATTRGLFESDQRTETEVSEMADKPLTVESLTAEHPDLVESIREAAVKTITESEAAKAKDAEMTALKEKVALLEAEKTSRERTAKVEAQIAEAKLPAEILTDTLKQTLLESSDERRPALIADLQKLSQRSKPRSKEHTPEPLTEGELSFADTKAVAKFLTRR